MSTFEGVEFSGDLTRLVAEQLATGRYRGREDGAPGDWLERAWHALPPVERTQLSEGIRQALTHSNREVRAGAVRLLDGNSRMVDPERLLDLVEQEWDQFKGLRGDDESPDTDRGCSLVQLVAACATGTRGSRFRTSVACDPVYGIWVLAALAEHESDWVADHIQELVTPTLDPNGARLTVLVSNLQHRPKVLRRAVVNLADRQPALVATLRRAIDAEVSRPGLREELLLVLA